MAKLPKYTLSHDDTKKRWVLKSDGSGQTVKTFATKAAATKGGVLERAVGKTGSVKIKKRNGKIQEERTYPRSADRTALRVRWRPAEFYASRVTRAGRQVVVDHAGRLHEGVDDRRSAEFEAACLEAF